LRALIVLFLFYLLAAVFWALIVSAGFVVMASVVIFLFIAVVLGTSVEAIWRRFRREKKTTKSVPQSRYSSRR
jgi:membrane protein implicated in regulation of membrane protease activity